LRTAPALFHARTANDRKARSVLRFFQVREGYLLLGVTGSRLYLWHGRKLGSTKLYPPSLQKNSTLEGGEGVNVWVLARMRVDVESCEGFMVLAFFLATAETAFSALLPPTQTLQHRCFARGLRFRARRGRATVL